WPRNFIDHFILARLEADGLTPSLEADKSTLVRRVYLDLLGFPPSPEEADAFVNDTRPDAYDKLLDRLFESPHYGERWARRWLDLARYADTNGYEKDRQRSMWPWRDWVINALNADLPFDQFTIDQLAGDMLPNATAAQKVATGFHRNTMLNEEGGIDPLEFRFYAMNDRMATTGTAWLGLTLMCAQCHNHKEPVMDVPDAALLARRAEIDARVTSLTADLPSRFPAAGEFEFGVIPPTRVTSSGGAQSETLDDGSVRMGGPNPERDAYDVAFDHPGGEIAALRLEVIADSKLPSQGPGRTAHGNFVLSELSATVLVEGAPAATVVKLTAPTADFSQEGFPIASAIDGKADTGWAIHGPGKWNVTRTATFQLDPPVSAPKGASWTLRLDQQHGTSHTIGRFRISLGSANRDDRPLAERRKANLDRKLAEWVESESKRVAKWSLLEPLSAKANLPLLTILPDHSIRASSDMTKRDLYDIVYRSPVSKITAIRLEAIPDDAFPSRGPGRVYYEGPFGDFYLSQFLLSRPDAKGEPGPPIKLAGAVDSFHEGNNKAAGAIDDDPLTGWSINGGQGSMHAAIFSLAEPWETAGTLHLRMIFEKYYAAGLGRFRVWVTDDPRQVEATGLPIEVEGALLTPAEARTPEQNAALLREFAQRSPELASARQEIRQLRDSRPALATTLVMTERPANEPRPTFLHRRGEFLQPLEQVPAVVPAFLPTIPADARRDRLTFARWLVSGNNPLTGRVVINRHWGAIFGRGLVRTVEDFGFQGESPSHPELLDWLAVEFVRKGWSLKAMHRLMVSSATYRQSSAANAELLARDPQNKLLARGPRFRLEAELVRDTMLKIGGLLSDKVGGPSVFPPQPPGVTSEGSYGGLAWNVSTGPDRYRRGLYTFSKRTAPFAMFSTFDSPSGEACVARREVSNTPLQALTLLNDPVAVESAQALGTAIANRSGDPPARAAYLFRRCLVRPPTADELTLVVTFYERQKGKLKPEESGKIAGPGDGDAVDRAAWTLTARALLNLDETITR
ncbi:MAG: DUF1549 and DUF1553 domain-containing protein, partial [Planctomycetota bacterium]|nr:DUF1549 and DUF1553 domain-containing protein [Planctomycetota bacterium]